MTFAETIGFYVAVVGAACSVLVIAFCLAWFLLEAKDKVSEFMRHKS